MNCSLQSFAERFTDIGEVKALGVCLGYTKHAINYVVDRYHMNLFEMSKIFIIGYIQIYDTERFSNVLQEKLTWLKKYNRNNCPIITEDDNISIVFTKYDIVSTFPNYEHILEMAMLLIQTPEIIPQFLHSIHCQEYSTQNMDALCRDTDRNDALSNVSKCQLPLLRGLNIYAAEEQCKVDLFDRLFELLCYWKEYSYSSKLNYELIVDAAMNYSCMRLIKFIEKKYENYTEETEEKLELDL